MKQGSIRLILNNMKLITFLQIYLLQPSKSLSPLVSNVPITVAPLAKHLPAFYTTRRKITKLLTGAKKTQSVSPTLFM
jgi:hypothetical protein